MIRSAHVVRVFLLAAAIVSVVAIAAPATAAAAETSLRLSVPTDFQGHTSELLFTSADGTLQAYTQGNGAITVTFQDTSNTIYWWVAFAAPGSQPLAPGLYYDTVGYPFPSIDRNSLQVLGSPAWGCGNTPTGGQTGSFEIKQVEYGGPYNVVRLWAQFEARCLVGPPVRGEIRWNADVGTAVTAPLDVDVTLGKTLTFPVRATSAAPGPISLTATGLPAGATFTDNGDGTGRFEWAAPLDAGGPYSIVFEAQDSHGGGDHTTTRVTVRGVDSLLLDSEPGDPLGFGQFAYFGSDDGDFVSPTGSSEHVSVLFFNPSTVTSWALDFAPPPGEALGVGVYEGAVAYGRQGPGQPGLLVSSSGGGGPCSAATGRFEVKALALDPLGRAASFWATFEQRCNGSASSMKGEIRFNVVPPVFLQAPTHPALREGDELAFDVVGVDARSLGRVPVTLSATGLPDGATFTDRGDGTGEFEWMPAVGQAGVHTVAFHGTDPYGNGDTVYSQINVTLRGDDFDDAVRIASLPFSTTEEHTQSGTISPDDPTCLGPVEATTWYAFTPQIDEAIIADLGVDYGGGSGLSVYTGTRGALTQVACGARQVHFQARAGETYYFMLGFIPYPSYTFSVDVVPPPPPNDEIGHATVIGTLPFRDELDTRGATPGADDPATCFKDAQPVSTVWYAFTPSTDTYVMVHTDESDYFAVISALTTRGGIVSPQNCGALMLPFTAFAGQTYDLMIGSPFGVTGGHLVLSMTGIPALSLGVTVDPDGSIDPRTGVALIHGTVTCSRPAEVSGEVRLAQTSPDVAAGVGWSVTCRGSAAWTVLVTPDPGQPRNGRFSTGPANVRLQLFGVGLDLPLDFGNALRFATVRLKPAPR